MVGINLTTAKAHLEAWLETELIVTTNQSYTIGNRSLTRANLGEIRKQIEFWNNKVSELENIGKRKGRNRITRVVPRDL